MNTRSILPCLAVLLAATATAPAAPADPAPADWTRLVGCDGVLPTEAVVPDPSDPLLLVSVTTSCAAPASVTLDPILDCSSRAHGFLGWRWARTLDASLDPANELGISPLAARAALQAGFDEWDAATSAEIAGFVTFGGSSANLGVFDGVNQIGFKPMGNTLMIATTWRQPLTGHAIEFDLAFNSRAGFSIGGSSTTWDLQSIATHAFGNNWGLADVTGAENACLTMYSPLAFGTTHARTLGVGDELGIQALYG